jgi:SAM-dependent methyltransferase
MTVRSRLTDRRFRRRWGFRPPPAWSDWVGYEALLEEIEAHRLAQVDGDVLEIGAFLGGGTAKLCDWCARHATDKRVVAVEVFDPEFDPTATTEGWTMPQLYRTALAGRDQRSVFDEVTSGCENLLVIQGDSTAVDLPVDRLAFAFVDGSHVPEAVRSDFELVWARLSPGGVAAFHDYGGDLPGVTRTLHERIGTHADEIARVWTGSPTLLFVQRG